MSVHGTSVVANLVDAPILRRLAAQFGEAGYELYLVGGSVRDGLLHRPTHDLDFATDAHPPVIKRLLAQAQPDSRYDVGEKFGTIGATFGEWVVEITTYRSEEYSFASRKPAVTFGTNLEDDLSRRDFTINAIAQEPTTGGMLDPFHGLQDLQRGLIRAVGNPAARFREDPLRMLRALRFAAELGFHIDAATLAAMREQARALEHVSTERIAVEMTRLLVAERPAGSLEILCDTGLAEVVMPELLPLRGTSQGRPAPQGRVRPHAQGGGKRAGYLAAPLGGAAARHRETENEDGAGRQGALLPARDGWRAHGHGASCGDCAGTGTAASAFNAWLRNICARISTLRTGQDAAVRRFLRETEGITDDLFALSRADITSYRRSRVEAGVARVNHLEARCRELQAQEDVAQLKSPLDGQRPHDHVRPRSGALDQANKGLPP